MEKRITIRRTTEIKISSGDIAKLLIEKFAPGQQCEIAYMDDKYGDSTYVDHVKITYVTDEEVEE